MPTLTSDPVLRVFPDADPQRMERLRAVTADAYRNTSAALHDDPDLVYMIWNRVTFLFDDLGHLIVGHDVMLSEPTLRQRLHDAFVQAWTTAGGKGSVTTAPYMKIGKALETGEEIVTQL